MQHKHIIIKISMLWVVTFMLIAGCESGSLNKWGLLKNQIRSEYPGVSQLSTNDLYLWLHDETRDKPILLDTRGPEEYAISHLRGAYLATSEKEAMDIIKDNGSGKSYVLYCSVGYRSSALAEKLMAKGVVSIYNLEGSLFQWANEEKEIYSGNERVYYVHPYSSVWKYLLDRQYWYDEKQKS